jgi:flagellar basal-body rod modification protein FlgD
MQTASLNAVQGQQGAQSPNYDAFQNLNLDTFIKLLVTELQNQDPMNPMDNAQILQQVSQIRAIESNTRLTSTLEAVLLGQNVSTASSLLGRTISGLDDSSSPVTGKVDKVSVAEGKATLHIGDKTVSLQNVGEILPDGAKS